MKRGRGGRCAAQLEGRGASLGLAGEQEKLKIAHTSSEGVARSELFMGRDTASITSGLQDHLGSVTSLTGEGPVPPLQRESK